MVQMPINLTTHKDILDFVEIANNCSRVVYVKSGKYCGNGKSLLSVLSTVEWDSLFVETDFEQISKFEKFAK